MSPWQFVADYCDFDKQAITPCTDFYESYLQVCQKYGSPRSSRTMLFRAAVEAGAMRYKSNGTRCLRRIYSTVGRQS